MSRALFSNRSGHSALATLADQKGSSSIISLSILFSALADPFESREAEDEFSAELSSVETRDVQDEDLERRLTQSVWNNIFGEAAVTGNKRDVELKKRLGGFAGEYKHHQKFSLFSAVLHSDLRLFPSFIFQLQRCFFPLLFLFSQASSPRTRKR